MDKKQTSSYDQTFKHNLLNIYKKEMYLKKLYRKTKKSIWVQYYVLRLLNKTRTNQKCHVVHTFPLLYT
jgi:hypothetical protein